MKYLYILSFLLAIVFLFIYCNPQSDNSSSCLENPDAEGKLIVIVGEKIEIKEVEPISYTNSLMVDSRFVAHYRILQKICGDYDKDTITFTVYDHYGFPAFGNYQHVLLFLTNYEGSIYHEKYLFYPLYKTKNGNWASSYPTLDYGFLNDSVNTVKPEKIEFAEEVSYSIEGLTRATAQRQFPEPYYKIDKENKKAIAVWGNYIPELFQITKEGVLNSRGFYGKIVSKKAPVKEVELLEFLKLSNKDSLQLIKAFHSLVKAIKTNDTSAIKKLSLDSLYCSVCEGMPRGSYENNLESINMLIDSANTNFYKSGLWPLIEKNKFTLEVTKYPDSKPGSFSLKDKEILMVFNISFKMTTIIDDHKYLQYHFFRFVKINDHFRFYALESH